MKPWDRFEAMEHAGGPADADAAMAALLEAWRRDGRRLVEDQWVEFSELARRIEPLIDLNLYNAAASAAQVASNYAVFWHTGAFSSPTLDRALFALGRAAIPASGRPERTLGARLRVLHVATQVGAIGGHARMLWRWIAHDVGNVHTVALTRQTGPIPDALIESVARTGGCVHQVNRRMGGLLRWAEELQALMQEQDLVVLHVHNQDVIPFIAMAGLRRRPRVLLLNHADHVFWLGAGLVDLVVNTRQSGRRLCSARRGIPSERNLLMPLCLEPIERRMDRAAAKRRLGLPEDSIVLLTVARAVKFRAIGGLSYADSFVPLLRRNPRLRLVAVGPGDVEDWSAAQAAAPGQIIAYAERPDTGTFFEAADVYVNSFPFISNTSMLEAGLRETPVITRYPFGPGCEIMGADSVGIDSDLIRATGLRDFQEKLNALIDDKALREEIGRRTKASLEAVNTGGGWSAALATVYERAFALPAADPGGRRRRSVSFRRRRSLFALRFRNGAGRTVGRRTAGAGHGACPEDDARGAASQDLAPDDPAPGVRLSARKRSMALSRAGMGYSAGVYPAQGPCSAGCKASRKGTLCHRRSGRRGGATRRRPDRTERRARVREQFAAG